MSGSDSVSCSYCGRIEQGVPLTWAREVDPRRGVQLLCDRCARLNLRSIEARLEHQWW